MSQYIIAWDVGTGGNKASLYDYDGNCIADSFISCDTSYPSHGWHEQRPDDWWNAVVLSTRRLLEKTKIDKNEVACCGISGHSLGAVPIGKNGELLRERTPIWSDGRATQQVENIFRDNSEDDWYLKTGNGFTPSFYTAFKILWYKDNEPDMYKKIYKVIGTKDYINFRLTGKLCTDPSYASGSGVWDLKKWQYSDDLISLMGLPASIFPDVVKSTDVIGNLTRDAAEAIGLSEKVLVVAGGVDNSCMALGAKAFKEGRVYNSLGSSAWIAVSSKKPLLDVDSRPYVFTHVVPEYYASALCTATGGMAFRWVRNQLFSDYIEKAKATNTDDYDLMTKEAEKSILGANKLLFNPSLGGGMPMDKSYNVRGAFVGLDLLHSRADIARAAMEGISMSLRACLDKLKELVDISDEMLLVGGGSKSKLWRQIYADVYKTKILKSNVDQQAAALGAAACAAVGTGIWTDFEKIDGLHEIQDISYPDEQRMARYDDLMEIYYDLADSLSDFGDRMSKF